MAQTTKKRKTSSTRKTNSKKKSNRKKKDSSTISLSDIVRKKEISSAAAFFAGLFLLIIALFRGGFGSFWNKIHCFYFALFGLCGYYIPVAILFLAIILILNKQKRIYYAKAGEIMLLFIFVCSFIHVGTVAAEELSLSESISLIYNEAFEDSFSTLKNGGIIGAILGGSIFTLCQSRPLSYVILSVFLIVDLMFLFGITLFKLFTNIEKPAKKVSEITENAIENKKSEIVKRRRAREAEARKYDSIDPKHVFDFDDETISTADDSNTFIHEKDKETKKEQTKPELDIFSLIENSREQDNNTAVPVIGAESSPYSEPIKQEKVEKMEPLSSKESEELNKSLDKAVSTEEEKKEYILPPLECLKLPAKGNRGYSPAELKANGDKLIAALDSFNVSASIVGVVPGPTVTRYELSPAPGVKISKFVGLADDLALHMAAPAGLRIEAPIPNKAAIGIEIPNKTKTIVTFREVIDTEEFRKSKSKLNVALGKDISGKPIFSNIAKMPHLLVAGTTGSGKSVCLNSMIVSLLYNATPDEVKILLIDPKQVEFGVYNGLPHLLVPVVSDPRKASGALGWAVTEMLSRYKTLNANGVRDITAYNSLCDERDDLKKMCHIVIFIDELSDLMTVAPAEVEDSIQRLAQMARAAGMHLVVATQRPSVDVITGVIKANIPSRIALTVKSQIDSRTIIDAGGAEKLMGNGDMLYYPVGIPKPIRVQGCYLSDEEIENVVNFIKANGTANYDDQVQQEIDRQAVSDKKKGNNDKSNGIDANDELLMRAIELFVNTPEKASISALQRHLGLGFAKAGRLMDTMEEKGIVGPHKGSKPRDVLITKAQWYEMNALSSDEPGAQQEEAIHNTQESNSEAE